MTKIKLCGLRTAGDIETVNGLMPDFAGFILCKRFWRYASDFDEIRPMLDPKINAVGVFVDDSIETVSEYISRGVLDFCQLHGNEDAGYIESVRKSGVKVIKAFRISTRDDLKKALDTPADFPLLDSGTGSGIRFDWELLKDIKRPYFLAGGLSPENVAEAINTLDPYAVDVSSGIETDRKKDPEKAAAFVKAVRDRGNKL